MKVKELELNNFRGFKHLKIQFPENNLAVFIGTNGSGKSSVLDALGMLFAGFVSYSFDKEYYAFFRKTFGYLSLSYEDRHLEVTENISIQMLDAKGLGVTMKHYDMGTQSLPTDRKPFYKFTEKNGSIPILIYYKTEKFSSTPKDETSPEVGIPFQFYAYKNSLNSKLNQFQDFKEWFKQVEDEEVRQIRNRNNFNYRDQRLESIRNALDSFLSLLTDDVYKNLSVKMNDSPVFKFKPSGHTLAINKNGQDFSINQLSDGEKTLIMLVCDIARRLTIANPALENKLEGEGVVMIDEIELHLHPAWQRNVLPALQQTFPNIQFIVTTHSPQVLGGIERESLFILKDFQLQEYTPHTKGRDSNSILKEVQGVDERLPAYREKLDKLAKLLDDENVNEAGKLLVELKKDLGERDVEIAKIETIMHFFDD